MQNRNVGNVIRIALVLIVEVVMIVKNMLR